MNDERSSPEASTASDSMPQQPLAASRRNFLRAGAAASPVLLTFVSRPVAAGSTCVVASSFVSVAAFHSHNPAVTSVQCMTRTCEAWYSDAWLPATGNPSRPTCLNGTVSALLGATSSSYNSWALWSVLQNGGAGISTSGEIGVLQHLISATLNVQQPYTPLPGGVSTSYLQSVWQNFKNNGNRYVLSSSGINWDSTQLIGWLRMLMYPYQF